MGRRIAPSRPTTAFATVDFDRPGRQLGFVMIPHSPDDDAWGVTRIPVAIIANGSGPTVIMEGGNHGDEYEGPIVISELIRDLDPATIQGRLILMPANNVHAVTAGKRTSTTITKLGGEADRVEELAMMLRGEARSDTTRKEAAEMLKAASKA